MIHLNTHFLGCEEIKNFKPSITDSHIVRLDSKNMWSYGPVLNWLSSCCHLAHSIRDVSPEPMKVSLLMPYVKRRKSRDESTNLDVLNFLISKMKPPPNGIIFSVIQIRMDQGYATPFFLTSVWPFIDKWNPQDHISVQLPEENVSENKLSPLLIEWYNLKPILEEYTDYKIKYVDYSMPIEKVYDTVLTSRLHISYTGASYWIAGNAIVPMLAYGPEANTKVTKEFGMKHDPKQIYKTQYGLHSPYNWMWNYDVETDEPYSGYNHMIYNSKKINLSTKNMINALANLESGDRDMWFM